MQRRDIIGWAIWIAFIIVIIVFGVTHLQFSLPNSFVIFLLAEMIMVLERLSAATVLSLKITFTMRIIH